MENRAYALAAGLFTLLLGIGVVAAALWFSGDTVENQEYLLVSRYPVSGLNAQAPVRYRGVTVGKVVDIRFDPLEPRTILVRDHGADRNAADQRHVCAAWLAGRDRAFVRDAR